MIYQLTFACLIAIILNNNNVAVDAAVCPAQCVVVACTELNQYFDIPTCACKCASSNRQPAETCARVTETLSRLGAAIGDVTVALTWDNIGDFNLFAALETDPFNYQRTSLDVNIGGGLPLVTNGVEYTVFTNAQSPEGSVLTIKLEYQLARSNIDPTKVYVLVAAYGRRQLITLDITWNFPKTVMFFNINL